MQRLRLRYVPRWEGAIQAFSINFCKGNEWRTMPDWDFDDLMQEGRILCWKIEERYPKIMEPKHMMAFYRTCLINLINRFANQRTRRRQIGPVSFAVLGLEDPLCCDPMESFGAVDQRLIEAEIKILTDDGQREAPEPIRKLLANLLPGKIRPRYIRSGKGELKTLETTNEYACKIAGLDPISNDAIEVFKSYLHGEPLPCLTPQNTTASKKPTGKSRSLTASRTMKAIAS